MVLYDFQWDKSVVVISEMSSTFNTHQAFGNVLERDENFGISTVSPAAVLTDSTCMTILIEIIACPHKFGSRSGEIASVLSSEGSRIIFLMPISG